MPIAGYCAWFVTALQGHSSARSLQLTSSSAAASGAKPCRWGLHQCTVDVDRVFTLLGMQCINPCVQDVTPLMEPLLSSSELLGKDRACLRCSPHAGKSLAELVFLRQLPGSTRVSVVPHDREAELSLSLFQVSTVCNVRTDCKPEATSRHLHTTPARVGAASALSRPRGKRASLEQCGRVGAHEGRFGGPRPADRCPNVCKAASRSRWLLGPSEWDFLGAGRAAMIQWLRCRAITVLLLGLVLRHRPVSAAGGYGLGHHV